MPLFKLTDEKIIPIKSKQFSREKDIQELTERNIKTVFGFDFVASEFVVDRFRIDTVGFDSETNSFIIIEYKNSQNYSVIDQGYAYLSLMLNHKAEFVLKYNENFTKSCNKQFFDWSQSRVIFISPLFTDFQTQAISFKDLPIELWEVKLYENDILRFNPLKANKVVDASISTVSKPNKTINTVNREIEVFTEEKLLSNSTQEIIEACSAIKDIVYQINSDAEEKVKKTMLCYTADGKGLLWVQPHKDRITLYLRKGEYKHKKGNNIPLGWGNYPELRLKSNDIDLNFIKELIAKANTY